MAQYNEYFDATIFVPHGTLAGLSEYFECVPYYLFRTSSPRTNGTTTKNWIASVVTSAAVKYGFDQSDILGRPWEEAVNMLENHLLWRDYANDNLTSWTNSFFFAVQHAIRREATDRPTPMSDSICISIVDTRKVPRGAFLPAVALLQAYNIESSGKLRHDCFHGEYLSQGRLASEAITITTLDKLITYGLYDLYPPFADISQRTKLYLRVLQLRESFKDAPHVPTQREIKIAELISTGCFLNIGIRPVIMMTLLSLKPRYRLDPIILEAFKDNCWGMFISDRCLESCRTASEHVPEHRQFTDMMHDVHAYTQRERQIKRATHDASQSREILDVTSFLNRLQLTSDRFVADQVSSDASSILEREDDEKKHQKDTQDVIPNIATKTIRCVSPKTRMIEMMEEEEEEQQRALDQIDDCFEETRPCPDCGGPIGETCFRRHHFGWCTIHERVTDEDGWCPKKPVDDGPHYTQCTEVYCDKTEDEAYWAEAEQNAILGGAGFREPGEPHVH